MTSTLITVPPVARQSSKTLARMIGDTVLLCGFTKRCIVTVHDHGALVVASADMALEDLNTCVLTAIDALLTTQREAQQC